MESEMYEAESGRGFLDDRLYVRTCMCEADLL